MVIQLQAEKGIAQPAAQRNTQWEGAHARGARNIRVRRACAEAMRLLWPGVAIASVCRSCGTRQGLVFEEPPALFPSPIVRDCMAEAAAVAGMLSGRRLWVCTECGVGEWERCFVNPVGAEREIGRVFRSFR